MPEILATFDFYKVSMRYIIKANMAMLTASQLLIIGAAFGRLCHSQSKNPWTGIEELHVCSSQLSDTLYAMPDKSRTQLGATLDSLIT